WGTPGGACRAALGFLLGFPPATAGGIMTTEFVGLPGNRTVTQVLAHLGEVARTKETIYAVYVVASDGHLEHVVSLRELLMADRDERISAVAPKRRLVTVAPMESRPEAARLV